MSPKWYLGLHTFPSQHSVLRLLLGLWAAFLLPGPLAEAAFCLLNQASAEACLPGVFGFIRNPWSWAAVTSISVRVGSREKRGEHSF